MSIWYPTCIALLGFWTTPWLLRFLGVSCFGDGVMSKLGLGFRFFDAMLLECKYEYDICTQAVDLDFYTLLLLLTHHSSVHVCLCCPNASSAQPQRSTI
jgi:hypothetical protein